MKSTVSSFASALAIGTMTFTSLSSAIAQTPSPSPTPPASKPPSLIGQCRAVKQSTPIYSARSTTSAVVRLLNANERVTLAENTAQDGLISISAPAKGFIQTANLKPCSGPTPTPTPVPTPSPTPKPTPTPTPTPTPPGPGGEKALCRMVARTPILIQNGGLSIRQDPNTSSQIVGGVAPGMTVSLTTNPATAKDDASGRSWVQIAKPASGWVSNGFRGGMSNLTLCP